MIGLSREHLTVGTDRGDGTAGDRPDVIEFQLHPSGRRTGQAVAGDRIVGRNGAGDAGAKDACAGAGRMRFQVLGV